LAVGNTTVNTALSAASIAIGNTTVNTTITPSTISTNGTLTVTGNTIYGASADFVHAVFTNTNIGVANTSVGDPTAFTVVNLFSFPVGTYTGAKVTAKITDALATNNQVQELILAQNGTDVIMTVYGTVASPASANLGVFSGLINTTHVAVGFKQTKANSSVKIFAQLIK
jgi:hypothetical protein